MTIEGVARKEKNNAISLVRLVATVFIVLCHFFQYYDLEAAWWFNVGVPMFFCISGFLYGGKRLSSPMDYLCKGFRKILIPYYCYLTAAIFVYFVFHREMLSYQIVFRAISTSGTVRGIEHLWFVSYILFCYLLTPYLQAVADKMKTLKWYAFLFVFWAFSILGQVLFLHFSVCFGFPSVFCYLFGYFTAVFLCNYKYRVFKSLFALFAVATMAMNGIRIYGTYVAPIHMYRFDLFVNYAHGFLGIFLVLVFVMTFSHIKRNWLLDLSDKYSFYIYIVHQLYILSPFTLLTATKSVPINVALTVAAILLSAILFKFVVDRIDRLYAKIMAIIKAKICSGAKSLT